MVVRNKITKIKKTASEKHEKCVLINRHAMMCGEEGKMTQKNIKYKL